MSAQTERAIRVIELLIRGYLVKEGIYTKDELNSEDARETTRALAIAYIQFGQKALDDWRGNL